MDGRLEGILAELARSTGSTLGSAADEHERWSLYRDACKKSECFTLLFDAVALEPDPNVALGIVLQGVGNGFGALPGSLDRAASIGKEPGLCGSPRDRGRYLSDPCGHESSRCRGRGAIVVLLVAGSSSGIFRRASRIAEALGKGANQANQADCGTAPVPPWVLMPLSRGMWIYGVLRLGPEHASRQPQPAAGHQGVTRRPVGIGGVA